MTLSCNEIVMGNIGRLTGFDPYQEENGEIVYALSIVRAFDNLVRYFRTRRLEEAPYPYQHLMKSITAENYDEATHMLELVGDYAKELMEKAGYTEEKIKKIIRGMLYQVKSHQQVFMLDQLRELEVKVKHYTEDERYARIWSTMKQWLRNYYLKPSPIHVIKYVCTSI